MHFDYDAEVNDQQKLTFSKSTISLIQKNPRFSYSSRCFGQHSTWCYTRPYYIRHPKTKLAINREMVKKILVYSWSPETWDRVHGKYDKVKYSKIQHLYLSEKTSLKITYEAIGRSVAQHLQQQWASQHREEHLTSVKRPAFNSYKRQLWNFVYIAPSHLFIERMSFKNTQFIQSNLSKRGRKNTHHSSQPTNPHIY